VLCVVDLSLPEQLPVSQAVWPCCRYGLMYAQGVCQMPLQAWLLYGWEGTHGGGHVGLVTAVHAIVLLAAFLAVVIDHACCCAVVQSICFGWLSGLVAQ
jgi:hypothetical protein